MSKVTWISGTCERSMHPCQNSNLMPETELLTAHIATYSREGSQGSYFPMWTLNICQQSMHKKVCRNYSDNFYKKLGWENTDNYYTATAAEVGNEMNSCIIQECKSMQVIMWSLY